MGAINGINNLYAFNPAVNAGGVTRRVAGGQSNLGHKSGGSVNPFSGKSVSDIDFKEFNAYKASITGAAAGENSISGINPFDAKAVSAIKRVEGANGGSGEIATAAWKAGGGAPVDSFGTGFAFNSAGYQGQVGSRLNLSC